MGLEIPDSASVDTDPNDRPFAAGEAGSGTAVTGRASGRI